MKIIKESDIDYDGGLINFTQFKIMIKCVLSE